MGASTGSGSELAASTDALFVRLDVCLNPFGQPFEHGICFRRFPLDRSARDGLEGALPAPLGNKTYSAGADDTNTSV